LERKNIYTIIAWRKTEKDENFSTVSQEHGPLKNLLSKLNVNILKRIKLDFCKVLN
jgi:hypothetical protein